ncbi:cupin domain-containing protein [Kitasatospora sp. LaBMicrA B282]|uniref:cupin domain-containing protein n=1 Tax=Kitasatospora sp. LaBMicrA B282 TaxID=3420949 RepID=UPI003D113A09
MRLLPIDRAEHLITRYGSTGAAATPLAGGTGSYHLTCLSLGPGGTIGAHPAPIEQLFLVISGEGWIIGPDGIRLTISAGTAVLWSAGEEHTSGTDTHLTALALEGPGLGVREPEDY